MTDNPRQDPHVDIMLEAIKKETTQRWVQNFEGKVHRSSVDDLDHFTGKQTFKFSKQESDAIIEELKDYTEKSDSDSKELPGESLQNE